MEHFEAEIRDRGRELRASNSERFANSGKNRIFLIF